MSRVTDVPLARLVQEQMAHPSPIRQIMKMAERQNILAMGLRPEDVISFGGGWVNHAAPEGLRQAYAEIAGDVDAFHRSGAYTATLGDTDCREQLARFEAHLFGVPQIGGAHVAIGAGSTQLTHDLFRTLVNPGDTVMLMDPTYANYEGQLAFAVPGCSIVRLPLLEPATWSYTPVTDPQRAIEHFQRTFDAFQPRLVLFGAPDNPTSQILPHDLVDEMRARTAAAGSWLVIDYAYKCQYFEPPPMYYSWSPVDHPHVVAVHSNSKWGRGLGRRLGWIVASPEVIDGIERVQQCSLLCADTLAQQAMTRYLARAIADGSLRDYIASTNDLYREAARVTIAAVDAHLQRPRLQPGGGLYTVVDGGIDAEVFVPRALQATGVLVVPGGGFGPSIKTGIRISYGPMVMTPAKIDEGLGRLGKWMSAGA
jgi:aspartate/methionine/tyrosine aminotransferase